MKKIFNVIILLLAFLGAYLIGRKSAESETQTRLTENYTLIKKIAELSTLEVEGNSEIDIKPTTTDSYYTILKNLFFENSIYLRVPYKAKYGVNLSNMEVKLQHEKNQVKITLPHASLLSYELQLDKISANNKRGWFVLEDDNTYLNIQEKLYKENRTTLEKNQAHILNAEINIRKILTDYFKPFKIDAEVVFEDSVKNKRINL